MIENLYRPIETISETSISWGEMGNDWGYMMFRVDGTWLYSTDRTRIVKEYRKHLIELLNQQDQQEEDYPPF